MINALNNPSNNWLPIEPESVKAFADQCKVLKASWFYETGFTIYLISSTEMSYFTKTGKPRITTKTKYHVYILDKDDNSHPTLERFHFTRKAEATKYFKSIKAL